MVTSGDLIIKVDIYLKICKFLRCLLLYDSIMPLFFFEHVFANLSLLLPVVPQEGEAGDHFYVIEAGTFACYKVLSIFCISICQTYHFNWYLIILRHFFCYYLL